MTNTLTEAKQDIADALTAAGITALSTKPDRLVPPMAVVQAGAPYIQASRTFKGARLITLEVVCMVAPATNEVEIKALDDMLVKAVPAIWDLNAVDTITVGDYYSVSESNMNLLAISITVTAWVTF